MDIEIRPARPSDAAALAELGAITFIEAFGHMYPQADLDAFLAEHHTTPKLNQVLADPDIGVWVAEEPDGRLVGYAQVGPADMPHPDLRPEHGELKRLYVLASHRNLGLGAKLLEPALDWLDGRGVTPVWLSVWSQNLGAQRFYERYGFRKAGEYEFPVGESRDAEFILRRG
jgi:ribosomal protein S18 acetylase RimI-like enzyme